MQKSVDDYDSPNLSMQVFFMTCNDNSVLPPVMKRRGRIDKEITLDYADQYQILMMFDRFFKPTHHGDEASWNRVRNNVAQAIAPGEFSTAELQGLFLDYTFYLERMANQTEDSFDALLDRIDEFKLEIQKTRHDWETHKNEKLDELRQKNQIKIATGTKKSGKAKANGTTVSHSSSSSSISSPTTSVSSSSTATTVSLENDDKIDQHRND
jgi:acyl-homoserine lactone acylase PvdQ